MAGKDVHFLISEYTCDRVSAQILDPKLEVMIQQLILKTNNCTAYTCPWLCIFIFLHTQRLLLSLFSLTEGSSEGKILLEETTRHKDVL